MHASRDELWSLAMEIMQLTERMQRSMDQAIDPTRLKVLQLAAARDNSSPTSVAAQLGVHPSSVSRHVQTLADAGLITSVPNPDDLRSYAIALTAAGRAELAHLAEAGLTSYQELLREWEATDVRTLTALLAHLNRTMEAKAPVPGTQRRPQDGVRR